MTTDNVIEIHQLAKRFGSVAAVQGIDLTVPRGAIFGFLGPNGAGKTTTIGMVLGLLHPSGGEVRVLGETVTPARTNVLRRVGSLIGAPALTPYLSARDNLRMMAKLHPGVGDSRIEEILEWVGLKEAAGRPAGRFSTGMKQRLGLGMALLARPELLILDEPTNGMDPAGMHEVRSLLLKLAEEGVTIFLSSHLLHEVEQVCTQVAVLNQGKIVAQGSVDELKASASQTKLKVRVAEPRHAAQLLAALPGAVDIQPNGQWVTVRGVSGQAVIRHLVAQDAVPEEVVSEGADLESMFLALTKEA